jgi:hypothetical protein
VASTSGIIYLMVYMPLTVWGSSLALDQGVGIIIIINIIVSFRVILIKLCFPHNRKVEFFIMVPISNSCRF